MQLDLDALRGTVDDKAYGALLGDALLKDDNVKKAFEAARKVAAQVVGRRVAPRDAGLVVRHAGTVVPGGITVAESGISALDVVTVGWAEQ